MNVENLAGGSQAMSGVGIAGMFNAVLLSPVVVIAAFAFFGKIHRTKVVDIGTFYVHDLSEYSPTGHIESSQCERVIAAVF